MKFCSIPSWRKSNDTGGIGGIVVGMVANAIRVAVLAEREACLRIVEATKDVHNISFCIAADIRVRGD